MFSHVEIAWLYCRKWCIAISMLHRISYARLFLSFIGLLVVSCGELASPQYQRPVAGEKAQWSEEHISTDADQVIRSDWWRNFGDPYLDKLIAQARENNIDLKILAARTGVAAAAINQVNATRLPTIDAALGANYQKRPSVSGSSQASYATALGWEVDVWGKLKKGVKAQQAGLRATAADWRAGYLTLAADVSATYFQIRQFDEQIDQQRWSVATSEKIQTIYESQLKDGLVPQTQVLQQQAEVSRLRKDLLELHRLRKLAANALATLLGLPAGKLNVPKKHLSDTVRMIPVPAGLPSELLLKRPDIIAAEYRVLQAYELEGQARLAKFPSISLTSNLGNTSDSLSNLIKTWSFGLAPTVSIPIFDPGVKARYKVSQAETVVVEEQYRKTVMRAFEEVESALVNLANRKQQHEHLRLRREKLDLVAEQIHARLEEGMLTQLEVFESERALLAAKQQLLANQQLILEGTVSLYKALGGGWPEEYVKPGG